MEIRRFFHEVNRATNLPLPVDKPPRQIQNDIKERSRLPRHHKNTVFSYCFVLTLMILIPFLTCMLWCLSNSGALSLQHSQFFLSRKHKHPHNCLCSWLVYLFPHIKPHNSLQLIQTWLVTLQHFPRPHNLLDIFTTSLWEHISQISNVFCTDCPPEWRWCLSAYTFCDSHILWYWQLRGTFRHFSTDTESIIPLIETNV